RSAGTTIRLRDDYPGPALRFVETPPVLRRPFMVGQAPLHRVPASCSSRGTTIVTLGILLLLSFPLAGEQSYVARFDVYGGYGFLNSPAVSLFEHGFAVQARLRPE